MCVCVVVSHSLACTLCGCAKDMDARVDVHRAYHVYAHIDYHV